MHINDDDENYSPEEIRHILQRALNIHATKYGYDYCEDSTRVLTIKKKNTLESRILHSCDFCIVYDCADGRQQYIHFNKQQRNYSWKYLPIPNWQLEEKAEWISHNGLKDELKNVYIEKKDRNENPDKRSRSLYAEAVSEVYSRNHYN